MTWLDAREIYEKDMLGKCHKLISFYQWKGDAWRLQFIKWLTTTWVAEILHIGHSPIQACVQSASVLKLFPFPAHPLNWNVSHLPSLWNHLASGYSSGTSFAGSHTWSHTLFVELGAKKALKVQVVLWYTTFSKEKICCHKGTRKRLAVRGCSKIHCKITIVIISP